MIVERVEHPEWLSNAYLVAEGPGGHGVFIDSNGLTETLEERAGLVLPGLRLSSFTSFLSYR